MTKTILVLAANPKDTSPLRIDQEIREISNGLERARRRDEFTLRSKLAVRSVDVRRAMLDYQPQIVHFCGHGSGDEGIALEDETGQAKFVNAEALTGFFELFADKVECVVLNACYSEVQAKAIAKHIPYVIGMGMAIGDTNAIEFAVAFYDALGAGESVEFAFKLACNAILWAGTPEQLTPQLHLKQMYRKQTALAMDKQTNQPSKSSPIAAEALVFIHIFDEEQRAWASRLKDELVTQGFVVMRIVKHDPGAIFNPPQVIYWNSKDQNEAGTIARIMEELTSKDVEVIDRSANVKGQDLISRQYEAWLPTKL